MPYIIRKSLPQVSASATPTPCIKLSEFQNLLGTVTLSMCTPSTTQVVLGRFTAKGLATGV